MLASRSTLAEFGDRRKMDSTSIASVRIGRALILCVEDDQTQRELLKEVLSLHGFAVVQASTAEEALQTLREAPVSLVIADHMLRGTTGTQLASDMKTIKPTVPIVLHSGTQPDNLHKVDAFIHKGEPVPNFLALIRNLVARFSS